MSSPDELGQVEVDDVDEGAVLAETDGAVRVLTLDRPDRRNAWTYEMGNRYFDLLDEADRDPEIRAVVVTGAGGNFCPGFDTRSLSVTSTTGRRRRPAKGRRMTHAMTVRKPMVAAISGTCAGFGLVQALHCDVRFAGESAVFATAFVRRGLNAEYGVTWTLPRVVGVARATDLLLSGRRIDAAEAGCIGLVNWVVPDDAVLSRALAYAQEIAANCSPTALALTKLQLHTDWHRDHDEAEDFAKSLSLAGENRIDFAEGVQSFVERRPPRFAPLADRVP